ncbi:gliding motility lipoprotein GldD [Myroides sp. LoEW2-1]|uniref:gliding motility lipoprotein GldD n=1 Tax=Myroides sp. LoEW2-1 TaxID=2683192 RepID=UPI0013220F38|nr:gliding motility lipoprotein GldD [Myroides sp. LoEW2-1]MVX36495.1 gliding motility lipoprotein GldD [Myroides sp. LoEW2-1]
MQKIRTLLFTILLFTSGLLLSCKNESLPKPKAFLALEYPVQEYSTFESQTRSFSFDKNKIASVKEVKADAIEIHYPQMKATIYLNYKRIDKNLDKLFKDAQKLTYEHFIKADDIIEQPYINPNDKVYGMFYSLQGDAATNVQFYVTDSVKNFLTASLYFYATPNYDSIYPAKEYIRSDMQHIIETLKWRKDEITDFTIRCGPNEINM